MTVAPIFFGGQNSAYRFAQPARHKFFAGRLDKIRGRIMSEVNRKGVFIGAYVPLELKESLRRRAASEHRTLSQEITRILTEAVHGKGLPTGSINRREQTTMPRRRQDDPYPRRRVEDGAIVPSQDEEDKL